MRITVAERDILAERAGDMGGDWTERRSLRRNDCGKKEEKNWVGGQMKTDCDEDKPVLAVGCVSPQLVTEM